MEIIADFLYPKNLFTFEINFYKSEMVKFSNHALNNTSERRLLYSKKSVLYNSYYLYLTTSMLSFYTTIRKVMFSQIFQVLNVKETTLLTR